MEKEILIEINEWNSGQTFLSIHEFNFHKEFKCRKDAESWANSVFKKVKFEKVVLP